MTKINDGGAAFPVCNEANNNGTMGMSVRDFLAAQAPVTLHDAAIACGWDGLVASYPSHDTNRVVLFAIMSTIRYEYADAMLAVRSGGQDDE